MFSNQTRYIELPADCRPLYAEAPSWPHPMRSLMEELMGARRTCDPLTGIRAVLVKILDSPVPDQNTRCHHFVPAEGEKEHGKHSLSIMNENRSASAIPTTRGHPSIAHGLSDPDQWSVIIAIGSHPSQMSPKVFTSWQVETCAALIRQCWRRYPNLAWVVDASLFDEEASQNNHHPFPWHGMFDMILGSNSITGLQHDHFAK